jgi:dUTP pyrophosphatase
MTRLAIPVLRLPHGRGLPLPERRTAGASGYDLMAAIADGQEITIDFCERVLVPTGIALQLPEGMEAQVRPRSGLALKHGVTVLNSPGREPFVIRRGQRIAQLVISAVVDAELVAAAEIEPTERGAGGFGSTGVEGN